MNERPRARRIVLAGVFWGAVWGLWEATAGYLVHGPVRVPGASSLVLVPFAVFCMVQALRCGGTARSVGLAAMTAAAIKLVDLFLPALTVLSVVNPAVAILLEGLAFMLVARRLGLPRRQPALAGAAMGAVAFNLVWRGLFLAFSAGLAWIWGVGMLRDGLHSPFGFLVRDVLASSAVIVVVLALAGRGRREGEPLRWSPGPLVTAVTVMVAVVAEIGVQLL